MPLRYRIILLFIGAVITAVTVDLFVFNKKSFSTVSPESSGNEFIGDASCRSCHAKQYAEWQHSDHFKSMQVASDSTVKGDFNNVVFTADGVTTRFFKRNNKFIINTQGEDGKNHDYEVKYTFGFTPLQQYLIAFPGGRMQVTRASWDVKKKKWFHQYKGQAIPAGDWLHWTGNAQNWNTTCADCHSTNLKKNYDIESDTYKTTYSVLNVSCEACHGPAKNHVDYINTAFKTGEKIAGSMLQLPKNTGQIAQINSCMPCHARRTAVSNTLVQSDELLDNYIAEIPSDENFHTDGQVKEEDFIYTSFLQSKMFHAGVKCSNCHNPHSGKLVLPANNLCMQCHKKEYNEPSHTFHAANSAASECKSCHMPGKYFMENDFRHDHSFRVPRPDLSVKFGTPNACNNCHNNKSPEWAARAVERQYGPEREYHFAEDLIPGSKADRKDEVYLLNLLKKTTTPKIVKATAASYLGNIDSQNSLNALLGCLKDTDAQVRYRALRSLANFNPANWIEAAAPLLQDKARAVRVAAADLFLAVPPDQLPQASAGALAAANVNLKDYLYSQADFASGNILIGDYYFRLHDNVNAEKFYLRGLKKDSLMNLARLNLSIVYNLNGDNQRSLQVLKTAQKINPDNERIYFNMALLYNEMNDRHQALACFEKAAQLKSANPRVYYNYGLLILGSDPAKAETLLKKGLTFSPEDPGLNYAMAYLYLNQKQPLRAMPYAQVLKRVDPNNPEYNGIFSALF